MRPPKAGLAAFAAVVAGLTVASPAAATTRVVTPGHSIQKAINHSHPGDTVLVTEGRYAQSLQIRTDDITLRGEEGAVLTRPSKIPPTVCNTAFGEGPGSVTGVCVVGQFTGGSNPTVTRLVSHVRIVGLTIHNFTAEGILIFGGRRTLVEHNHLDFNGGYGAFANTSRGTRFISNEARGNHEAGFYVGDSPHANAVVHGNLSTGNGNGIFLRSAEGGNISENVVHDNCIGILVLAKNPGPSGNWDIRENRADRNNKPCPPNEGGPPTSGIGIGLLGANDTTVVGNHVNGNRHKHPSFASGGIVVGTFGTNAPSNVLIKGNVLADNSPFDIHWDGSGTVRFRTNDCERSKPSAICH